MSYLVPNSVSGETMSCEISTRNSHTIQGEKMQNLVMRNDNKITLSDPVPQFNFLRIHTSFEQKDYFYECVKPVGNLL